MGVRVRPERFDDWYEAYRVCRARNQSLVARVGTETARIWPNGEYALLHSDLPDSELDQHDGDVPPRVPRAGVPRKPR